MNAQREVPKALFGVVRHVVDLLASHRLDEVASLTGGRRLSAAEMESAVADYPGTLVPLPDAAADLVSAVPIAASEQPSWDIVQPLFTAEEGRSDLSLLLTVTANADGGYLVCVDDIHVL